jgi:hypothetical protein
MRRPKTGSIREKIVQDATGDRITDAAADATRQTELNMPTDIPILPNSQALVPSPNLIKCRSAAGAQDAAQFYQVEMPKRQWVASQQHLVQADLAVLSYAKDSRQATIIIHHDDGAGTRIMIMVTAPGRDG